MSGAKAMKCTLPSDSYIRLALVLLIVLGSLTSSWGQKTQSPPSAEPNVQRLEETLDPIRTQYKLPALAAAVVRSDRTIAIGAVGNRKMGSEEKVTVEDKFHIGSCTKSMTATVAAMLVEEGKLTWDRTIADAFPDLREKSRPQYLPVTLEQLLSHCSGLPEDRDPGAILGVQLALLRGPAARHRPKAIELALKQEPKAKRGEKLLYSNLGYMIAGAMAGRATEQAWEDLIRIRLFEPLGMTSAGFGPPGTLKAVDQPRGHQRTFGLLLPVEPVLQADNPACLGPAGTVHCSIGDFAKYASFHLRGAREGTELLSRESFRKLHTDALKQEYGLGWGVLPRGWADGEALTHSGSNGLFYAVTWIAPRRDLALVVATNCAGADAAKGCDTVAGELIRRFNSK